MCQSGFPNVPDPGARYFLCRLLSSTPLLSALELIERREENGKIPQKSLQEYSEFFSDNFQLQQPPPPPSSVSLPPSRSPISPWGDFLSLRLPILSSFFPANPNALDRCNMQMLCYLEGTECRKSNQDTHKVAWSVCRSVGRCLFCCSFLLIFLEGGRASRHMAPPPTLLLPQHCCRPPSKQPKGSGSEREESLECDTVASS